MQEKENTETGARLLSKNGKLILAWLLLNSIPIGYMNVVPLVYLLQVGLDPSIIASIYAAGAIANTIGLIPFGLLADRYGRRKFLIAGGALPCISYALFAVTTNPIWLITASIIGGVGLAGGLGVAMNSPALLPLLANSTTDKNRTTLFGITQGVWIGALSIGSLLSYLPSLLITSLSVTSTLAHSLSYGVMSLLVIVSTIPALFIVERKSGTINSAPMDGRNEKPPSSLLHTRRSSLSKPSISSLPIVSRKKIAEFSVVFALAGLGLGVIVQLLPTWYSLRFGTSEETVGLWTAMAGIISLVAIPLIPRLVKRRGTVMTSAGTAVLSCVFLALIPLTGFFEMAALLFIIRNLFVTISWPVLQSYMMGVVGERERASTIGITNTAWALVSSIGTFVGGAMLASSHLLLPFVVGVGGYLASALVFPIFFRRIRPPEESEPTIEPPEIKTV